MHELALTADIVEIVLERAQGDKVTRVILEVGALAGVEPDALAFSFDVACEGTPLEGATLEIAHVDGRARCRACAAEIANATFFSVCACGSSDLEIIAGEELRIRAMEIETT